MSVHSQIRADPLEGSVAAQKSSLRNTYHTTATAWPHLFSQQARGEGVLHGVGVGGAHDTDWESGYSQRGCI